MSSVVRYKSAGPETLLNMVDQVAEVLVTEGGVPAKTATALAIAIANRMGREWGGDFFYFPKGTWNGGKLTCFELEERNRRIAIEYNGANLIEVCAKYNISSTRLYQIIADVRAARRTLGSDPA